VQELKKRFNEIAEFSTRINKMPKPRLNGQRCIDFGDFRRFWRYQAQVALKKRQELNVSVCVIFYAQCCEF
jgi:hypothetical protein